MKKPKSKSDVSFSQENVLHYRKTNNVFPVNVTDWERLKGYIKKYPKISLVWWSIFTFFLSLLLELTINYLAIEPSNVFRTTLLIWGAACLSAVVISLLSALSQKHTEEIKKEDILEEMKRMEEPMTEDDVEPEPTEEDDSADPAIGQENTIKIIKATYGAEGQFIDVTDKLSSLINEGKLVVTASNALAGDPAPGIKKLLEVELEIHGEKHTQKYNENDEILLP